jgi:hypothetical protein
MGTRSNVVTSRRCSGYAVDVRLLIAARGRSEQAQSGSVWGPSSERFLTHGGTSVAFMLPKGAELSNGSYWHIASDHGWQVSDHIDRRMSGFIRSPVDPCVYKSRHRVSLVPDDHRARREVRFRVTPPIRCSCWKAESGSHRHGGLLFLGTAQRRWPPDRADAQLRQPATSQ